MKKRLAMLLACVMAITMMCVPALAEDAPAAEVPAPVPLQEQISALATDYPSIIDITGWNDLTGTWYPVFIATDTYFCEAQGFLTISLTMNADGTAQFNYLETATTYDCRIEIEPADGKDHFYVSGTDMATGNAKFKFILDNDPLGMDEPAMIFPIEGNVLAACYCDAYGNMIQPARELAPVVTGSNVLEDVFAASTAWELADTNVMDRLVRYDSAPAFFVVERGTMLEITGNPANGNVVFRVAGAEFAVSEVREDGTIILTEQAMPQTLPPSYTAARLHEDGILALEYGAATDLYQVYTIDPLTEYTDKETTKAVQEAMNAEGFECGTPDGIAGKKTAAAISGYQAENGLTETGTITYELLQSLRGKGYDL